MGSLCCNDGVGLFAIGTARLKLQHLHTMTLITQHKPIERSTDMVFMTKKSQIQVWLNSLYTEIRYGQRVTSRHVRAGRRPGVPAPVMIKRNPILHHPWRSKQYAAVGISLANQNQTYQHMIRVPAGLLALSCSCCCFSGKDQRPLDRMFFCHSNCCYFVNQFANTSTWNMCHFQKSFCQNIICQSIVLPKYIILPKDCDARNQS